MSFFLNYRKLSGMLSDWCKAKHCSTPSAAHSLVKEPYVDRSVVYTSALLILTSGRLASCHKLVLSRCVWTLQDLMCVWPLQDCTGKGQSAVQTVLHLNKPKSPLSENSSLTIQEGTDTDPRNPDIIKLRKGKWWNGRIHTFALRDLPVSWCGHQIFTA